MSMNPLDEKGIPLERQLRSWPELAAKPYDKHEIHPYSRCRIIVANGAEMESMWFSHQFARHCPDQDVRRALALGRRIEMQQQKAVSGLIPGDETTLEVTIGYEQVAVDLTCGLARNEPDKYVKQALEFGVLEDFDHLYRYADLMSLLGERKAEEIVGDLTEIFPGRPTLVEHRHPHDDVRRPMNAEKADIRTILNTMTIVAAEQQTLNFYANVANRPENPLARALYVEIGQIEEQHVTHYESLLDPTATWFERLVLHEYNECWLYHSFMEQEVDSRLRAMWELHLGMEIAQLQVACALMQKHQGRDARELLPDALPPPIVFQPNKEYVRQILRDQIELTGKGESYVPLGDLPPGHRFFDYQQATSPGGEAPSQRVIEEHIRRFGQDYRHEPEGPHPIERFRDRKAVPAQ